MTEPLVCENYELTVGNEGSGVVLTFDVDDVPAHLAHVESIRLAADGFHAVMAADADGHGRVHVLFPTGDGVDEIAQEIQRSYGRLHVAALGPGDTPDQGGIAYSAELVLAVE